MSEVTARALARSSLHMHAVQLAEMALRLVLTPLVIARVGLEGYGVGAAVQPLGSPRSALSPSPS